MDSACCRGTSWYHRTFPHGTIWHPRCKFKTYSRDDAITLQRKISILCLFQFTSFNAKFRVFPSKVTIYAEDGILLLNHQDLSTRLIHLIPPAMAARSKNLKSIFLRRAVLEPQMSAPSAQCHADMRLFEQNDLLWQPEPDPLAADVACCHEYSFGSNRACQGSMLNLCKTGGNV